MSEASIKGFVEYRQAYQRQLAGWMTEQGVDAVVFPGEASTIHLNDSNESSFARETPSGTRIDPQASNAGVPTAIFPAGFSAVGQPDNLQLEGPAFSDPELLGMAYAFENVAHGHEETKVAPALKYVEDGVVTPPAGLTTSPESTTTPPAGSASATDAGSSSSSGSSTSGSTTPTTPTPTTTEKATAHLDGAIKITGGKLVATVACTGTTGSCQVILEVTSGKATMEVPVTLAAGKKKTIKVKPTQPLAKAMKAYPKAKLSVRLVAPEGKAKKVKVS
jgi:hypothetical protein